MAFNRNRMVDEIVVTVPSGFTEATQAYKEQYGFNKLRYIIEGKESRSESVYEALCAISPETEIVLVHDGVRPMVAKETINRIISAAKEHGAAVTYTKLTDTIKEVDAGNRVVSTPKRDRFRQVQTPQGFTYKGLLAAYEKTRGTRGFAFFTDDSSIYEAQGGTVYLVNGKCNNIKITTPDDLLIAEALQSNRLKKYSK
jgi:2-C-methyl-D-erythritol 4-phosphate cytidylyltransferase